MPAVLELKANRAISDPAVTKRSKILYAVPRLDELRVEIDRCFMPLSGPARDADNDAQIKVEAK